MGNKITNKINKIIGGKFLNGKFINFIKQKSFFFFSASIENIVILGIGIIEKNKCLNFGNIPRLIRYFNQWTKSMNHVVVIMFILYLANKRPILCICSNFNPKSVTVMLGEIENFINDRQQKDVMYVRCTPPTKIFQSGLYIHRI